MSATVTCDRCGTTKREAEAYDWWKLERHNPLLEFGRQDNVQHFCSTFCLAREFQERG